MKTESLREVRNNLSKVIDTLGESGPVLITKSGKTRAMLIPEGVRAPVTGSRKNNSTGTGGLKM